MVAILVIVVAMGVFQLGLALHVRNTLLSCASEGARLGARAGAQPTDGERVTRELAASALSAGFVQDVRVRTTTVEGVEVVEVTVSAPMPVIGLLGPSDALTVIGRAFKEDQ